MELVREIFKPEIGTELDVKFTMISEIFGFKKEAKANEILQAWADKMVDGMTQKELAEYAAAKKKDTDSQQLARLILVDKVINQKG